MTKPELEAILKSGDKAKQIAALSPIIDHCADMLLVGILKKNVAKFLSNNKITGPAADSIIGVAVIRAERFSGMKVK